MIEPNCGCAQSQKVKEGCPSVHLREAENLDGVAAPSIHMIEAEIWFKGLPVMFSIPMIFGLL